MFDRSLSVFYIVCHVLMISSFEPIFKLIDYSNKTVKKDWIERRLVALVKKYVLRDEIIDGIADSVVELQKQENTVIPFLQKQLAEIQKRIDNLLNAIEEGLLKRQARRIGIEKG